jgi:hypothetical protein
MWGSIATAPAFEKVLIAPQDRVLWPIVLAVLVFGVAGVWVGRRQRRAGGADAGRRTARDLDDTGAE